MRHGGLRATVEAWVLQQTQRNPSPAAEDDVMWLVGALAAAGADPAALPIAQSATRRFGHLPIVHRLESRVGTRSGTPAVARFDSPSESPCTSTDGGFHRTQHDL